MDRNLNPAFADLFGLEDFSRVLAHHMAQGSRDWPLQGLWRAEFDRLMVEAMVPAVCAVIAARLARGDLGPVIGSDGRSGKFTDMWNDMVGHPSAATRAHALDRVGRWFAITFLVDALCRTERAILADDEAALAVTQDAYDALVERVSKGAIAWYEIPVSGQDATCPVRCEPLHLAVTDWQPVLGRITCEGKYEPVRGLRPRHDQELDPAPAMAM